MAGVLGAVSIGLPWGVRREDVISLDVPLVYSAPNPLGGTLFFSEGVAGIDIAVPVTVTGLEHPVRLLAVVAVLLVGAGVRLGSRRIAWIGLGVAATALPIGGVGGAGRVVLLIGISLAVLALLRADGGTRPQDPASPVSPDRTSAELGG